MEISIAAISQVEKRLNQEYKIPELARDIQEKGLLHPIVVRRKKRAHGTHQFDLLDGLRRVRAFQRLGRTTIEAIIKE